LSYANDEGVPPVRLNRLQNPARILEVITYQCNYLRMSNESDGIVASSTIGDGGTPQDTNQEQEQTVPLSRLQKVIRDHKKEKGEWEARFATLESRVNSGTATKAQEAEYEELAQLSPAQALKRMAEIAEEKAYARLKSEQSKSQSDTDKALQLMDD